MSRNVRLAVVIVMVAAAFVGSSPSAGAFVESDRDNFFGAGAGNSSSSSANLDNAFFGGNAGFANTSGFSNAFFGHEAGASNVTGAHNSYFGRGAGAFTTTSDNAFFGYNAGTSTNTGFWNSFFGSDAGSFNTTGARNAFFGKGAGNSNTTGSDNAAFGQVASGGSSGNDNASFGTGAGANLNTGNLNSLFGRAAGGLIGAGNENAVFGAFAGLTAADTANSLFGARAVAGASITNATAVGHRAQVSQSNSVVLGSINGLNSATSNVKVGIGTAAPSEALHVRRTDGAARILVEEASTTALGRALFQLTNNGAPRFRLENTSNGVRWDFQASSGPGSFVIDLVGGPGSLDFELRPSGDLVLRGTATATGFITSSDRTLKTDITRADAPKLSALLDKLDISTWRFRSEAPGTVNLGPMAQDFHRLFGMGTPTTINVRDLAALALVVAREQQKEIDALKTAVAELSR